MRRLYVPRWDHDGKTIVLPDTEAHHARDVLRAREGDRFQVLNGEGGQLECCVVDVARKRVELAIETTCQHPAPRIEITLIQGTVKGKTMDWIVEKATELGAARIIPVICEHSVSVPDARRSEAKVEHWRDTAISALKQCGSPWLPDIGPPMSFDAALSRSPARQLDLLAGLVGERQPLAELLAPLGSLDGKIGIGLWIGPEGDFSATEYARMEDVGIAGISLGQNVLRSETAAIAGLGQLFYELDRSGF
jgi:16S rRNA (uracil1498-N3)-methyltransferase